jgi:acyl-CoA hydrolase
MNDPSEQPRAKTSSSTRTEMSEIMQPTKANFLGKVFGGSLLALIDLCAYTTAARFSGEVCVTASFDRVDFHEPIEVGEVVRLIGHVSYVGRTSVEVTIEVFAENIFENSSRHTNTARVTMVAIDEGGRPIEVPRLIAETREDRVRFLEGRLRRELRLQRKSEYDRFVQMLRRASEEDLGRLMGSDRLLEDLPALESVL